MKFIGPYVQALLDAEVDLGLTAVVVVVVGGVERAHGDAKLLDGRREVGIVQLGEEGRARVLVRAERRACST